MTKCTFRVDDVTGFKQKMLSWTDQFNIFCFLDNADYSIEPHSHNCLLAGGVVNEITSGNLQQLDHFIESRRGWVFGHLSYELKNAIHHFETKQQNKIGFPDFYFFQPQYLLQLDGNHLTIHASDPQFVYQQLLDTAPGKFFVSGVSIEQQFTKEQYIEKIKKLQQHILRGDCYEINFCQEFFSGEAEINPLQLYQNLVAVSPNPFAAFYRLHDKYLICASPERFICKKRSKLYSQPMKGTIGRNLADEKADTKLKEQLKKSAKDQSENVMVVDLVRNDLSRICEDGSVKVEELFGVYTYPNVHQMISTVSGELKKDIRFSTVVEATFPMGSMTGAPKHRVIELIEGYEESARGIFSGSVGYIDDEGDFDFNVVIRSIMYNSSSKYLSYKVGSGITFYSDPEKEWEECLLKAEAIKKVLASKPAPSY